MLLVSFFSLYSTQVNAGRTAEQITPVSPLLQHDAWHQAGVDGSSVDCRARCAVVECSDTSRYDGIAVRYTNQQAQQQPVYYLSVEYPALVPDESARYSVPPLSEYFLSYHQVLERNHILRI